MGFGPVLYAYFSNGLAYQYLPGETLNVETCMDADIYPLVADKMAQFHRQLENMNYNPSGRVEASTVQPILWDKLRSFLQLLPETMYELGCTEKLTFI